jgi:hypothetical protein
MKSLFDKELPVNRGRLQVAGDYFGPDDGSIIYWQVSQGDTLVARGVSTPENGRWQGEDEEDREWEPGPARAVAVQAEITREGAQAYTWWMRVDLVGG